MRFIQWSILSGLLLIPSISCASQEENRQHALKNPQYEEMRLGPKESFEKYISNDFSTILNPRSQLLGYIGNRYKRLHIDFESITRVPGIQDKYSVAGKSVAGKNVITFKGDITITSIREYREMHYGVDELKNSGIQSEGSLIGKYKFEEDRHKPNSGVFSGLVTAYWYVDKSGKLRYDDIEASFSDGYKNNQYVGTWTSYRTGMQKTANWGEYRIPYSGDLDIGASEFYANPKYRDQGWGDMIEPYSPHNDR